MPVVTIRGQLGSGAPEIGKTTARLIGGDFVDGKMLEDVAEMLGRPVQEIENKEHISTGLTQKIADALGRALQGLGGVEPPNGISWKNLADDDKYLYALKSVILELALSQNIVLRGRGSQFILHNFPSALHVLVTAPLSVRITRVMAITGVDEPEARRQISDFDNSRRAFVHRFFDCDVDDPVHYDVVLNTEHLTYDSVARIIVKGAEEKAPWG